MNIFQKWEHKLAKYPIDVIVWELRANSISPRITTARRKIEDDGTEIYILKDDPDQKLMPKDFFDFYAGEKTTLLNLFSPKDGAYVPFKHDFERMVKNLKYNEATGGYDITGDGVSDIKLIPESQKNWLTFQLQKNARKWNTQSWATYAFPIVMIVVTVIMLGVFWKITAESMQKLADTMGQIANTVADSAKTLKGCIPPPPPSL